MRTTRTALQETAANLRKFHKCDVAYDGNANGVAFTNAAGSTTLSGRYLNLGQAKAWLDGFTCGIVDAKRRELYSD